MNESIQGKGTGGTSIRASNWKYIAFGILGISIAVGSLTPIAWAAPPTDNILQAISNAIDTITGRVGTSNSVVINGLVLTSTDATTTTLIPFEQGKTHSGHISFGASNLGTSGNTNTLNIFCLVNESAGNINHRYNTLLATDANEQDFSCMRLDVFVADNDGGGDAPPVVMKGVIQYTTSSQVTAIP